MYHYYYRRHRSQWEALSAETTNDCKTQIIFRNTDIFLRFAHITQASWVSWLQRKFYTVFVSGFHSWQLLHFQEKFLLSAKEIMHVLWFYYYYLLLSSYQWKPGWWHLSWTFALHGEEKNNKQKSKSKNKNLNRIFFRHHNSNKKQSAQTHNQCAHTSWRRYWSRTIVQLWHVISLFYFIFFPPTHK